jgi:hemoglobin
MSTTPETIDKNLSLYERIGGAAAVDAAVDVFYHKVLSDYRINRFFDNIDMKKQAIKQKAFFTVAFGGPNNYTGSDMRHAHAKLVKIGLSNDHFNVVMAHLEATLRELNVTQELIEEVTSLAESTRKDVLGK